MGKVAKAEETDLSFSSSRFDAEEYSSVASRARLVQIHLTKSTYEAKVPDILMSQDEEEVLAPSFQGGPVSCHFDDDSGWLFGEYEWQADVRHGRRKVLKQRCRYVVVYENLKDCDAEYTRLYFSKIGRFTTYPYFRAQFSNNVSSSGLSIPPLPSLTDRVD